MPRGQRNVTSFRAACWQKKKGGGRVNAPGDASSGGMTAHLPSRVASVRCLLSLPLSLWLSLFFLLITALACRGIIEKHIILTGETLEERLVKGKAARRGSKSCTGRAVNNTRVVSRWASFDRPLRQNIPSRGGGGAIRRPTISLLIDIV